MTLRAVAGLAATEAIVDDFRDELASTDDPDQGSALVGYQFDPASPFSVPLMQKHINDGVLSAAYFGVAMSNTTADQSAAFGRLGGWLRNEATAKSGRRVSLGPYDYNVEGGVDLTNIRCDHGKGFWAIDGKGARIIGRTAGLNAVLDVTRSLGGRLDNVTLIGDSDNVPKNGLQLARAIDKESADFIVLNNVKVDGSFSQAAFYNFASERFAAYSCLFRNAHDALGTYAYIIDGRNKFDAQSDFYDIEIPVDTPQSCLSQLFTQTSFMRPGSVATNPLDAIYATRASRIRMINCYGVGTSGGAVMVFGSDGTDVQDIELDLHAESASLGNVFRFESADGSSTSLTVDNFAWKDNNPYSTDAYFRNEMSGDVVLRGASINLGGSHDPAPTNGMFYPKAKFRMRGDLRLLTNAPPANIDIARFDGDIRYHNAAALTLPSSGSYRVIQNAAGLFKGPFEFSDPGVWPTGTWDAEVTFQTPGDLSVTYQNQSGSWTKIGDLVFVQIEIAFTPTHTTASGSFRISGLPYPAKSGSRNHSALILNSINAGITWPTGVSALSVRAPSAQSYLEIRGIGSGVAPATLDASNIPSGTAHTIMISGVYKANA